MFRGFLYFGTAFFIYFFFLDDFNSEQYLTQPKEQEHKNTKYKRNTIASIILLSLSRVKQMKHTSKLRNPVFSREVKTGTIHREFIWIFPKDESAILQSQGLLFNTHAWTVKKNKHEKGNLSCNFQNITTHNGWKERTRRRWQGCFNTVHRRPHTRQSPLYWCSVTSLALIISKMNLSSSFKGRGRHAKQMYFFCKKYFLSNRYQYI